MSLLVSRCVSFFCAFIQGMKHIHDKYHVPGRNMDYEKLNIEFTVAIVKAAIAIKAFPKPLKPYVTPANVYDRTPNPDV